MVTPSQMAAGVVAFAETELLPAMSGWQLWTASAALVLAGQRADALITTLAGNEAVKALGLVDEQGNIDIEAAAEAVKGAIRKHGKLPIELPVFGCSFKLSENDVETLRGYITRGVE